MKIRIYFNGFGVSTFNGVEAIYINHHTNTYDIRLLNGLNQYSVKSIAITKVAQITILGGDEVVKSMEELRI